MSHIIRIDQSVELPLTNGILEVDTSKGEVTIFMKSGINGDSLTIRKISDDRNLVSLYSDTCLIDGNEITLFGLPEYAKVRKGKVRIVILKSDGEHWQTIREE